MDPDADSGLPSFQAVPLSRMRQLIGARMLESKQLAPHFYVTAELALDGLVAARERLRSAGEAHAGLNDCFIAATARALMKVPALNSSLHGKEVRTFTHANVAVAVATPSGVVAPVIRMADSKSLASIAAEGRRLIGLVRSNRLSPDDYRGATFTVSNLGMFGASAFTAIITPPQAGVLALGRAELRPVVRDGILTCGTRMTATLSADHRIVDGATGAAFLSELGAILNDPGSLLA